MARLQAVSWDNEPRSVAEQRWSTTPQLLRTGLNKLGAFSLSASDRPWARCRKHYFGAAHIETAAELGHEPGDLRASHRR